MSEQGARIYDVGYRAYDGPRSAPVWALVTIWRHTVQRVLGLHRSFRHKVLPGIALVIAFVPALIFVGIAAFLTVDPIREQILPSYGEYTSFITMALALFASLVAPEALCTDRRTGMLDLYLAGPLDVKRYLAAKWAAVAGVMLVMTAGPQLFILAAYAVENAGPSIVGTPLLLLRILVAGIGVALFYTAVAMAVSSLTTRRAVAAVATVLVLLVPTIAVGVAVDSSGAPDELALATPGVATEFAWRVFGDPRKASDGASSDQPRLDATRRRGAPRLGRARGGRLLGELPPPGPAAMTSAQSGHALIEVRGVSKWFGSVVAVSDVSFDIGPGVTALLGPNGAGKSTMLRMLCGLARPSKGTVRILGSDPRTSVRVTRQVGLVPQQETVFEPLTALGFVRLSASLYGLPDPDGAARAALETVELDPADERRLPTYSKGMRQRVKLAQAIVHDPRLIVLDEPLTGLDPRQRAHMIELFQRLGGEGRCVIVASHVLDEVERFGSDVLVMAKGRLAAAGDFHEIRALMDDRPRRVVVRTSAPRLLAADLLQAGVVVGVRIEGDDALLLDTEDARGLGRAIAPLARARGASVLEVRAVDEDLEDVFRYLVER